MKSLIALAGLTTVLATALAPAAPVGAVGGARPGGGAPPPGDTIVGVTGDRANGFEIQYYDGTADYPPTGSEARAECSEYDTRADRIRCRVEVRTWYRDLADLE